MFKLVNGKLVPMTDDEIAQRTAEDEKYAAEDKRPIIRIDLSVLLEKLTRDEKAAAGVFMIANPSMLVDILEAAARGDFRADNPDTGRFTQALIDAKVVTPERLAELLS